LIERPHHALRRGLDLGLSIVDTAEMYGDGEVERMVAKAVHGMRDRAFLVSKVLPMNASRRGTVEACERSLGRLATDRLDLYLLHAPGDHPLEETLAAFEALHAAGKIRAWGLSNFDDEGLESALEIAGGGRLACVQNLYHLKERTLEHAVIPWCEAHDVAVMAYSPLGRGDFPSPGTHEGRVLAQIATKHGATAHQVALRFLTRHDAVFAVVKASSVEHVEENAGAMSLELSDDDLARLEEAFPRGEPARELPTL